MKNTLPASFPVFSFDELSLLAITDSAAFEESRSALINSAIHSSGNNSTLLTQLQNRLDQHTDADAPRYLACLRFSIWLNDHYRELLIHTEADSAP